MRRLPAAVAASPILVAVAACVVLAALSLLLPSAPSYDPWAWIAWGREIFELDLNTRTGPSWKPLPVLVTTLTAPIEDASPWVWLVIARAGGLFALVMAVRVGRRLVGGPAGWVAGGVAALALATSADFGRTVAMGYSEGLLVALLLGGVEAHLRGRRGLALGLAFAATLLRPETWPFAGVYGLYLWIAEPGLRVRLAALGAAVPALWFLPELWGSGDPFRASSRAQEAVGNAPALAEEPAKELLKRARWALIAPVEVGVLLAVAGAVAALGWRPARDHEPSSRPLLVLAVTCAAWVALVAVMTERGYAGNERYLMAPVGLACVLSGVGWARAGLLLACAVGRGARVRAEVPVAATLALVAAATAVASTAARARADELDRDLAEIDYQAQLSDDLDRVIARAGGPERLRSCGKVVTGDYHVPAVAWRLRLHGVEVGVKPEPAGTVIRAPAVATWPTAPRTPRTYSTVARAGRWEVLMRCEAVSGARAGARPPR